MFKNSKHLQLNSIYFKWLKSFSFLLVLFLILFISFATKIIFTRLDSSITSLLDRSLALTWEEYNNYFRQSTASLTLLEDELASQVITSDQVADILESNSSFDIWIITDNKGNILASNGQADSSMLPAFLNSVQNSWQKDNIVTGNESVSLVQLATYKPQLVKRATPTNNTLTEKGYWALFQITAVPYKRNNKTAGAIIAAHLLNNDNSISYNISTRIPNSYSDISCNGIRISGNISSETNPSYIGMLQQPKQIETIEQGKRYYGQNKLAKDLDHLVVSDPIYNLQGKVIGALTIGQPSQGLDHIKEDTMIYISMSALLCLAIVLGISAMESKKGAAPIIRLSQIAKQIYEAETISDEHLAVINNLEPTDIREMKDLQLCFSRMSNSLYKQKQEILRYLSELEIERNELQWLTDKLQEANTTLEAKVQEKTMELKNAITNLKTLNNHKTKFLLNTSHELRTPLNSIIGFSEMLYDELYGPLNEKQKEYVQILLDSAHHLLKLINDILDLSLIEQNKITIYKQSINLSELIASVLNIIKNEADNLNILIVSHVPPDIPNISVDSTRIKQVLYNILSNAVKFTPAHGQINLAVHMLPDYVQISVTDTGIGIKQSDIDFVFDDFYQGETLYEKKYEGAGLGLPLSKRLIELHNGKIELSSTEGNGTKVTIYVPYQ